MSQEADNTSVPVGLEEETESKLVGSEKVASFGCCQVFSQSRCQTVWQKVRWEAGLEAKGLDLQGMGVVKC